MSTSLQVNQGYLQEQTLPSPVFRSRTNDTSTPSAEVPLLYSTGPPHVYNLRTSSRNGQVLYSSSSLDNNPCYKIKISKHGGLLGKNPDLTITRGPNYAPSVSQPEPSKRIGLSRNRSSSSSIGQSIGHVRHRRNSSIGGGDKGTVVAKVRYDAHGFRTDISFNDSAQPFRIECDLHDTTNSKRQILTINNTPLYWLPDESHSQLKLIEQVPSNGSPVPSAIDLSTISNSSATLVAQSISTSAAKTYAQQEQQQQPLEPRCWAVYTLSTSRDVNEIGTIELRKQIFDQAMLDRILCTALALVERKNRIEGNVRHAEGTSFSGPRTSAESA